MVSMGILEINGFSIESTYGRINLSWWPIVSSTCSIVGLLFGSLWIYEPVSKKTNKWIGFFTFLPIFFFRLLSWQILILLTVELSLIVIIVILFINTTILYAVQSSQLVTEPLNSAILSIVLPMYKLPSTPIDQDISTKVLTLLVCCGNMLIVFSLGIVFTLQSFGVYNPWDCNHKWIIKFREEWFQPVCLTLLSLFVAATVPSVMIYIFTSQKLLSLLRKMR